MPQIDLPKIRTFILALTTLALTPHPSPAQNAPTPDSPSLGSPSGFVDRFDKEYSKDIEPIQGGFGDAYDYQHVAKDRLCKGVRPLPPVTPRAITLDGNFAQWRDVQPEFRAKRIAPASGNL